jgi:hypothetical protein
MIDKTYKEQFTSGILWCAVSKKGQKILDALWNTGMFVSKSALRNLFKEGAIKKIR